MRVTKNLAAANGRQMMNEPNQTLVNKSPQSPTASLPRNDQMTAWRDFEVRKSKYFSLQVNTAIQFSDCRAFANYDF